jgi:hypothetical protein
VKGEGGIGWSGRKKTFPLQTRYQIRRETARPPGWSDVPETDSTNPISGWARLWRRGGGRRMGDVGGGANSLVEGRD